jgi:hypothetical protein
MALSSGASQAALAAAFSSNETSDWSRIAAIPILARAKRRVAARLESRAMHADSRQSDICGYLSAILLVGLGANALFGWWWADPVAALAMVPIIGKEGIEALRGQPCACGGGCRSGS